MTFSRTKRDNILRKIFLVSQGLSFILKKQTSKNVADTTFNCKHPKYHLRDEKMKSLHKIKGILHENGIEVTVKQITDKIHSLRKNYFAERCKEEAASKKSGSLRDDLYTSKWLFFQPLSFLRNNLILRVTEKLKMTSNGNYTKS